MPLIKTYQDLPIGPLQRARLYLQARPLASLHRKRRRSVPYQEPADIKLIDRELTGDFISLDCAGWYFANSQRTCTAIEMFDYSLLLWPDVKFEYDYMDWRPTYLENQPVLAYYSSYFKYCALEHFLNFCDTWSDHKLIIGLDPTKMKFNYLKYRLVDILSERYNVNILAAVDFNLLFTLCKKH